MQVIPDAAGETLPAFAEQNITAGSAIHSDAFRSYNTLSEKYDARMEIYDPEDASEHLKWLHVMIQISRQTLKVHIMNWTARIYRGI